ncbi:hypothetical protein AB1Y20_010428 [Prymnesium parvum]|uniref:C2 NT-type domain-containing protein n=1 Tax=Prymnesium parvum TaxID=97485 RepID=A0AB34IRX6_PRYPA
MTSHFTRRGPTFKYHFSIHVSAVTLRDGVQTPPDAAFSVAWKRGEKLATTSPLAASTLLIACEQTLSLVCTMYKAPPQGGAGVFASKDSSLTLLQGRAGRPLSTFKQLGKVQLDLAPYASIEETRSERKLVLLHDGVPVADVALVISSRWLKNFGRVRGESANDLASSRAGSSGSSGWPTADEDTQSECASDAASDAGSARSEAELDTDDEIALMEAQHKQVKSVRPPGKPPAAAKDSSRRLPRLRFGLRAADASASLEEWRARAEAAEEARAAAEAEADEARACVAELRRQLEEAEPRLAAQADQAALYDKLLADVEALRAEAHRRDEEGVASALALSRAQEEAAAARREAAALREEAEGEARRRGEAEAESCRLGAAEASDGEAARRREEAMAAEVAEARAEAAAVRRELEARAAEVEQLRGTERAAVLQMSREVASRRAEAHATVAQLERRALLFASLAEEEAAGESARARRQWREAQAKREEVVHALADALLAEGKRWNAAGDTAAARGFFEQSYVLQPRAVALLSVANMSLKLCERETAAELYRKVVAAAEAGGEAGGVRMAPPNDKELAMAERKLVEALGGGEAEGGAPAAAEEEPLDPLSLERQLRLRLSAEVVRLQAQLEQTRGEGAPAERRGDGGEASAGSQLEAVLTQLHRAKAETARALREKAAMAKELLQQTRLQRKAKEQRLQLREANTKLEVQLLTQGGAERRGGEARAPAAPPAAEVEGDEAEAMLHQVLQEHAERVMLLTNENHELRAQLIALEAKMAEPRA